MNPKDSNIYRKTQFGLIYDSKGVERGLNDDISYKHTILSGLKSYAFLLQVIEQEFGSTCGYSFFIILGTKIRNS
jgi:hypothetical protein